MTRSRVLSLAILVLAMGAILWLRLVQLQVVSAEDWRFEAETLASRERSIPFRRGSIRDRTGQPVAFDEPTHSIDFEYRAFRLRHPLAQAAHALLALDAGIGTEEGGVLGLAAVARHPSESAARLLAATPARLADVEPAAERNALRGHFERLLGLTKEDRLRLRDAIRRRDRRALGDLFAPHAADVAVRLEQAVHDLARLDERLGKPAGSAVERLEAIRLDILGDVESALERRARWAEERFDVSEERARRRRAREMWLERFESDVPFEAAEWVSLAADRFPGFSVAESMVRRYPEDRLPWVVGTLRARTEEEARRAREEAVELESLAQKLERDPAEDRRYEALRKRAARTNYPPGDRVGSEGVEEAFESDLHGVRGVVVESIGRRGVRADRVEVTPPVHGRDVWLALDFDLQRAAEEALAAGLPGLGGEPMRGAVAVIDARNGDVLALAATPDFTREDLRDKGRFARLLAIDSNPKDPAHPLHHRGYRPWLPPAPGSCFKVVTALAALDSGLITTESRHRCDGRIGTLRCEGVHGEVGLVEAMEVSCNVYFGWLGEKLGLEALRAASARCGFGVQTGFDAREVKGGFEIERADAELLRRCGVGYQLSSTPLQVARLFAAIGNGGLVLRLRAARRVGDRDLPAEVVQRLGFSDDELAVIRQSLHDVVAGPHGTARATGLRELGVAGKTGTAEVDSVRDLNHAWFAGYAPYDEPRIAFAAYVEKSRLHGKDVTPILKRLLESDEIRPYLEAR